MPSFSLCAQCHMNAPSHVCCAPGHYDGTFHAVFCCGKSDQRPVAIELCYEVQIWQLDDSKRQWVQQGEPLKGHTDWVRDVAWAPNLGMPMNTIASAGQDGKVVIWTEQSGTWNKLVRMACNIAVSMALSDGLRRKHHLTILYRMQ